MRRDMKVSAVERLERVASAYDEVNPGYATLVRTLIKQISENRVDTRTAWKVGLVPQSDGELDWRFFYAYVNVFEALKEIKDERGT